MIDLGLLGDGGGVAQHGGGGAQFGGQAAAVGHEQVVAGGLQVQRHRAAHDAEADESDLHVRGSRDVLR
jgi:hypothetical protein